MLIVSASNPHRTMNSPAPPPPDPPHIVAGGTLAKGRGPVARLRYARAYFANLDGTERRNRVEYWLLKPGLGGRVRRFLFPSSNQTMVRRLFSRRSSPPNAARYRSVDTWTHARDQNLADVEKVLRSANIPFAVIDDRYPTRRQVGVAGTDKARVIAAFERFAEPEGILVGTPWTNEVQLTGAKPFWRSAVLLRRRLQMSTSLIWSTPARIGSHGRVFDVTYGTVISFWATSTDRDGIDKALHLSTEPMVLGRAVCRDGTDITAALSTVADREDVDRRHRLPDRPGVSVGRRRRPRMGSTATRAPRRRAPVHSRQTPPSPTSSRIEMSFGTHSGPSASSHHSSITCIW